MTIESREYVIKTERRGNHYKIIGEEEQDHRYGWSFIGKGRNVILLFGARINAGRLSRFVEPRRFESGVLTLGGDIGDLIESGKCMGHQVFFVNERSFPSDLNPNEMPLQDWNEIMPHIEYTSRIIKVYKKIH